MSIKASSTDPPQPLIPVRPWARGWLEKFACHLLTLTCPLWLDKNPRTPLRLRSSVVNRRLCWLNKYHPKASMASKEPFSQSKHHLLALARWARAQRPLQAEGFYGVPMEALKVNLKFSDDTRSWGGRTHTFGDNMWQERPWISTNRIIFEEFYLI